RGLDEEATGDVGRGILSPYDAQRACEEEVLGDRHVVDLLVLRGQLDEAVEVLGQRGLLAADRHRRAGRQDAAAEVQRQELPVLRSPGPEQWTEAHRVVVDLTGGRRLALPHPPLDL